MEPAYLRRNTERGNYDIKSAKAIFDDCFIAHVSYVDRGLPACLPMIALVTEEQDDDGIEGDSSGSTSQANGHAANGENGKTANTVAYLHGHPSTKIVELVRKASRDADTGSNAEVGGDGPTQAKILDPVKVCITATKVDGLAPSSAPNGHTFNYRSAVLHGTCELVRGKAAKRNIMRAVTNHIVTNRWEEVNPVASYQISLVHVIKVRIDSLSVKVRAGPPGIQPRSKEVDGPDIDSVPWTGVIPLWEQLGAPVESGLSPGAKVSENLEQYIDKRNKRQEAFSRRVAN